jgi:hypothetical protein
MRALEDDGVLREPVSAAHDELARGLFDRDLEP